MALRFDPDGLIPAIIQHAETREVLMMAWMNARTYQLTIETGQVHFWSRSRQTIWHKGATSGNTMEVLAVWLDCDGDALLIDALPAGPACHTGAGSCFFNRLS